MKTGRAALRCWAEIELDALRQNIAAARAQLGATVKIMAVIKANAYGHGAGAVAQALRGDVEMYGVANVTEGLEARAAAPQTPILILGPALPEEREQITTRRFIPLISTLDEARAFDTLARKLAMNDPLEVHLAIDTGMGRMGIWEDDALAVANEVRTLSHLRVGGISSHLPSADEDEEYTREQLARFHGIAGKLRQSGMDVGIAHVENSAGIIGFPTQAGDLVRAGLMLYGSSPLAHFQPQLRPAMTWKTRVTLVRTAPQGHGISYGRTYITAHPTRVATLAAGYADGYQRHLTHRGAEVLIRGRRCPVLGRITMDQIVVDASGAPGVEAGEEAVLMGRQGTEEILAGELARKAGTIPWEIFTSIGKRVERVYV